MSFKIVPTGFAAGAEIRGVNLAEPIGDNLLASLDLALAEHGVIFFLGQDLTPEQQMAVTLRFGKIEPNTFGDSHGLEGYPGIVVISNIENNGREIGVKAAGENWHSDMCYTAKPPRGTILYAKEVPKQDGLVLGDTCFAACNAAYNALPEEMKRRLENVRAIFDFTGRKRRTLINEEQIERFPPVSHPIVRTHPVTGEKCLYVMRDDCTGIDGVNNDEADHLIAALANHIVRPEFVYRHQWRPGDLLIWDNCTVQHKAIQDYVLPSRRLMHRTTFAANEVPM
ncbi:MAG: TauD/TfdA family dioxygenase [Pseudomonadota bacterium]|nr:TauD/TfdA family dioxygenase [Pseudomonadota bacterium]